MRDHVRLRHINSTQVPSHFQDAKKMIVNGSISYLISIFPDGIYHKPSILKEKERFSSKIPIERRSVVAFNFQFILINVKISLLGQYLPNQFILDI
jgi:hypothetical protein